MTSNNHRRQGKLLLALTGALLAALLACSVASAATNIPTWKSGGKTVQWGKAVAVNAESMHGLNLHVNDSGVPIWVTCETLATGGTVENPAAGAAGTFAPTSATFKGCQLIKFGEMELGRNLICEIPKELAAELSGAVLTNSANPNGGLQLTTRVSFTFSCTGNMSSYHYTEHVTMQGIGNELLGGEIYFSPSSTEVTGSAGTGEAEYGVGFGNSEGPVTIGELPYEEPKSTSGTHWYKGGAERSVNEGLRALIGAGAPAAIGGHAKLTLETNASGVPLTVTCAGGSVTGNVENPLGGGAGTASVGLGLTGCGVAKPAGIGCVVTGSSITTKTMAGKVNSTEWPSLEFGEIGFEIASFNISGCSVGALNHVYRLKGKLFVKPQMKAAPVIGSWAIPATLNGPASGLVISGQSATASGEVTAEIGGEVVTMG